MVYDLTKAVAENRERLISAFAGFESWQPEHMVRGTAIPPHPGAVRYYAERGWN